MFAGKEIGVGRRKGDKHTFSARNIFCYLSSYFHPFRYFETDALSMCPHYSHCSLRHVG